MTDKQKILVVDDDLFVRRPLETAFQRGGFDAVTAADGPGCLAALEQGPPDLIILDIVMPGPDGFEVCKSIKNEARSGCHRLPDQTVPARGAAATRAGNPGPSLTDWGS